MKTSLLIEKVIYAMVIILLMVIALLIYNAPPGLLDVRSVYQVF